MHKIYKKIRRVQKQIAEAKSDIENIEKWDDATCKPGEKKYHIDKLNHWIGELNESLLGLFKDLEWAIQQERNKIQNEHAEAIR